MRKRLRAWFNRHIIADAAASARYDFYETHFDAFGNCRHCGEPYDGCPNKSTCFIRQSLIRSTS